MKNIIFAALISVSASQIQCADKYSITFVNDTEYKVLVQGVKIKPGSEKEIILKDGKNFNISVKSFSYCWVPYQFRVIKGPNQLNNNDRINIKSLIKKIPLRVNSQKEVITFIKYPNNLKY